MDNYKRFQQSFKTTSKIEIQDCVERLFDVFGKSNYKQQQEAYLDELEKFNTKNVVTVVEQAIRGNERMPSLSELIVKLRSFTKNHQDSKEDILFKAKLDKENQRLEIVAKKAVEVLGSREEVANYLNLWLMSKFPWMQTSPFRKHMLRCALFDLANANYDIALAVKK